MPVVSAIYTGFPSSFSVLLCETNFRLDSAPYSAGVCKAAFPKGIRPVPLLPPCGTKLELH